jgi:hypothetical protein
MTSYMKATRVMMCSLLRPRAKRWIVCVDKFPPNEVTAMKQITNKEYEEWQKYKAEKAKGHVLLPDTVRFICEANGYDAEKIGQHFLEILPKICPKEE